MPKRKKKAVKRKKKAVSRSSKRQKTEAKATQGTMNSSLQEFMQALEKTKPTSTWQSMGKITDGEVIHTIEAKDITQVLAKYQSYEVLQNSNISQIFQQILPIEVEHTTAEYEKKVYAEKYEFDVDERFPRVCFYGNFNYVETTTMLNDMFDEETTKIILAFGCGVRKLLFATEPEFPDDRPIYFSVRSIFYKRTRGSLVLQTYDKKLFNKEVALFVGIVFELCKDLEYDEEFESEFAHEFDFPNYLDQLEGKKKEKIKKKSKPLIKIAKEEKPKSRRLFGGTQRKKLANLQNTGSLFQKGSGGLFGQTHNNCSLFNKRSGGLFGQTQNTGSLVSPIDDKAPTSVLVGRLSRSQLEQLVVNAADLGKTITKQAILDLLPSNTQTQSRGLFGANS